MYNLQSTVSFEAPAMKSPPTKAPTVEKSVSFEEPQKVDTLTNLTKVYTCTKSCYNYIHSYVLCANSIIKLARLH